MQKHKSIINFPDSYPIVLKKELAVNFGLKEAIVLQQINFWVQYNKKRNKNFKCGRWWTYNTLEQWKEQFPFWSTTTIHNIFKNLRDSRLIFAEKLNQDPANHVMFYTINSENEEKINLANKLLFESHPIVVSRELAHKVGLNAAIVLQQIQYWLTRNEVENQNFHHEKYWVFNTMESWHKELPFFTFKTLEKVFVSLFKEGLILKANFHKNKFDKTNWYTINYEHEIFKDPNAIVNKEIEVNQEEEKSEENLNNPDFPKMGVSSPPPNNPDFPKMGVSSTTNSENHIVTKLTNGKQKKHARAREAFLIKDFSPSEQDQDEIMKKEKLEREQFANAFKEYVLFCKKNNPNESKSYDMFLSGLELWCSRYHEVKRTKPKVAKKAEDNLQKLIDWTHWYCKDEESRSFFNHLITNLGAELFNKTPMFAMRYRDIDDGFVCLIFNHTELSLLSSLKNYQQEIKDALMSFKSDLRGMKIFTNFDTLILKINWND